METKTMIQVILVCVLAAAIVFHGFLGRFEIVQMMEGAVVRLDRLTGTVVMCAPSCEVAESFESLGLEAPKVAESFESLGLEAPSK